MPADDDPTAELKTAAAPPSSRDDDPRLTEALVLFLEALEAGRCPDRSEFLAKFPEIAAELTEQLEALQILHEVAAGNRSTVQTSATTRVGEPRPDATLGDFRLLRVIGRGGMGIVYEAEQLSLGRPVAVKVLPLAAVLDSQQLKRFRNEARAAATLDHPHIVPVYYVGCERGIHFYAMQLIQGQSLADLIAEWRSGGVDEADEVGESQPGAAVSARSPMLPRPHSAPFYRVVAQLGLQAAEALESAHRVGIVHRDIKPGNLLVDLSGKLWVADFGLACFEHGESLTRAGGIVGTAAYMSPEQSRGSRSVDGRSDLYSLGATLQELLVRDLPQAEVSTAAVANAPLARRGPPVRRLDPRTPRDLATIVLKAMSASPADRYATAQAMADDLRRFIAGRPIQARRLSVVEQSVRWLQQHRRITAVLLAGCLLSVAAIVAAMAFYTRQTARHAAAVGAALAAKNQALITAQAASRWAEQQQALAEQQRERAEKSELFARRMSYCSDTQLAYQRWQQGQLIDASQLLERHRPQASQADLRGAEWYLLDSEIGARLHRLGVHNGPATECVVFPDGRRAASTGEDGLVQIWDLDQRSRLAAFEPAIGPIHALAVSPDGLTLAVGGSPTAETFDRASVYLLDAGTGAPRNALHGHETTIESIAFAPDGTRVVSGARYADVKVSSRDGNLVFAAAVERRNETVAFAPDGQLVAAILDHNTVRLWEAATGAIARDLPLTQAPQSILALAWSPQGSMLAVACSGEAEMGIRDSGDGQLLQLLTPRPLAPERFSCLAFSHDQTQLVAGDSQGGIHVWSVDEPAWRNAPQLDPSRPGASPQQSFFTHRGMVTDLDVTRDGEIVATGEDGTVKLITTGRAPHAGQLLEHGVTAAAAVGDSHLFLGSADGAIRRRDLVTGTTTPFFDGFDEYVADLAVSQDGACVAAIYATGRVVVLDAERGDLLWSPVEQSEGEKLYRIALSPHARLLASTGVDNVFRVWDFQRRESVLSYSLSGDGRAVAFSPDARLVACGADRVRIFAVDSGQLVEELVGGDFANVLQFSPDGRYLASGHHDHTIRLFDLQANQRRILHGHRTWVENLAFSSDGKTLFSLDREAERLHLWDVETGEAYGSLPHPAPPGAEGYCRIVATNQWLVCFDANAPQGTLRLWQLGPVVNAKPPTP